MRLRHYVPLALAVFVLVCSLVKLAKLPIAPFAVILAFGELLLAFQVDHHKLGRLLRVLTRGFTGDHHAARLRHVH